MREKKEVKTLILHHNDRDGYMAAACVYYASIHNVCKKSRLTFKEVDYTEYIKDMKIDEYSSMEEAFEDSDVIFLVDYSIQNKENAEFVLKYTDKVIWLDHHLSSINMSEEIPGLKEISGLRIVGVSGALLTWLWVNREARLFYNNGDQNIYEQEELEELLSRAECVIPSIIKFTHRYDIWDLDENVESFNFGYSKLDIHDMEWAIADEVFADSDRSVKMAINDGKVIRKFVVNENESIINSIGIPFELEDEDSKLIYSVLLVNMPKGSSLKFGKYADEYDILMPFSYTKSGGISYSMYRGNNCKNHKLNLARIAGLFSGGGHAAAAGFFISNKKGIQIPDIVTMSKDKVISLHSLVTILV